MTARVMPTEDRSSAKSWIATEYLGVTTTDWEPPALRELRYRSVTGSGTGAG